MRHLVFLNSSIRYETIKRFVEDGGGDRFEREGLNFILTDGAEDCRISGGVGRHGRDGSGGWCCGGRLCWNCHRCRRRHGSRCWGKCLLLFRAASKDEDESEEEGSDSFHERFVEVDQNNKMFWMK